MKNKTATGSTNSNDQQHDDAHNKADNGVVLLPPLMLPYYFERADKDSTRSSGARNDPTRLYYLLQEFEPAIFVSNEADEDDEEDRIPVMYPTTN